MIKLTAVLLGNDLSLIGFRASGKPTDFGMLGKESIDVNIGLSDMLQRKFVNNQIDCSTGRLREIGGFKVRNLPSAFLKEDGNIQPCSNKIDITARFMSNNEPIGYRVRIGQTGQEFDMSIKNIITMTNWLNPNNFVIKHSAQDRMFICGKPGIMKLEELPVIEIGDKTSTAKRPKSSAQSTDGKDVRLSSDVDILDIFETVSSMDGFIIKLAGEEYKRTAPSKGETSAEFISAGLPEVSSGFGSFNPEKLSVNSGFRKIGTVYVDFGEQGVKPVYTYTYATKSLISSGTKHISSIVVGVTPECKNTIIEKLCKSMGIKEVDKPEIVNPVRSITGVRDLQLIAIDTSKLELLAKSKIDSSLLSVTELYELLKESYKFKFTNKYLKTMIPIWDGESMVATQDMTGDIDRSRLFKSFQSLDYEQLNSLILAGIDIFDGSYTNIDKSKQHSHSSDGDDTEKISIAYAIKSYDINKITGKEIAALVEDRNVDKLKIASHYTPEMLNQLRGIAGISNIQDRIEQAKRLQKEVYRNIEVLNKKLWQHECAMLSIGNYVKIHDGDAKDWVLDDKFRGKTGMRYNCAISGMDNMSVTVTGVTIG